MDNSPILQKVGQIYVPVHDVDKAIAFYKDSLGLNLLFQVPNMVFFDCGGVRLMLGIPEKPEFDHPSSILYFNVENIHEAYETFSGRGVSFMGQPHKVAELGKSELWMAFFKDPDGNVHVIQSEVPK